MESCRAPSYKAIAIALLKNDHSLKTLGFTQDDNAIYSELKRIKLESDSRQLDIKF